MSYTQSVQFDSRRRGSWNRNQNTVAFASAIKLGPVMHIILISLMLAFLGLIYLVQATKISGYDYQANEISERITSLSQEKESLEVENARLTALQSVKDSNVAKAMVTPGQTTRVSE